MSQTVMITPDMADWQIYEVLEARLRLYTALWFSSLSSENYNLQYTAILIEVFKTKALMDLLRSDAGRCAGLDLTEADLAYERGYAGDL